MNSKIGRHCSIVLLASLTAISIPLWQPLHAQAAPLPLFEFTPTAERFDYRSPADPDSWSLGFSFTTASDLLVSGLGFYDSGLAPQNLGASTTSLPDGLAASHEVGVFSFFGTLLVRGTVPAGTSGTLIGHFRYTSSLFEPDGVTPIVGDYTLPAGDYTLAAVTNGENYTFVPKFVDPKQIELLAGVTFGFEYYTPSPSTSLDFPTTTDLARDGYFGPNMLVSNGSVGHPGDFDGDGDVDGADFVAWQTNFPKATGALLSEGDADGDGDVDGADFVVWQTNFPFSPAGGAAPVPEPSGLLMAAIGAVVATFLSRRAVKWNQEV